MRISVAVGNTIPITCPVPYSVPDAIVQFYKDGNVLQNASLTGSKTMIIERVMPYHAGSYHCTATNYITSETFSSNCKTALSVVTSGSTTVSLDFVKQPQTEYRVVRGKNVTLECFGVGYPVPQVTWSRLSGPLPPKSYVSPMGLNIVNVQPADRGEYDCQWSNERRLKTVIILNVVEPPRVTRPPKALTFSEGGELELSCAVSGQPEPSVEWLINGERIDNGNNNVEIKGSKLFIAEVEKRHAGIVQCVASNEYGSHSGYNMLRVNPKQHLSGAGSSR